MTSCVPPGLDPLAMLRPRRRIAGYSAILLPFTTAGAIDWPGFTAHVARTQSAGLVPAVNMDTGYVNLLDEETRQAILRRTQDVCRGGTFVAGAFVGDQPGAHFDASGYRRQMDAIREFGGTPVVFQSFGLTQQDRAGIMAAYRELAHSGPFIGFELGTMFAPFGAIYDLATYSELMQIPECLGAKHSSLSRVLEWQRLQLRDRTRPDFKVFTGNDLAIDMVMYGSDYLLGLSTFAPDLFARRDACWQAGDPAFYEINDLLQYLGCLAFRPPVPAYKHNAAQFLQLRGWIGCAATHPGSPSRPDSDRAILQPIADAVDRLLAEAGTESRWE